MNVFYEGKCQKTNESTDRILQVRCVVLLLDYLLVERSGLETFGLTSFLFSFATFPMFHMTSFCLISKTTEWIDTIL